MTQESIPTTRLKVKISKVFEAEGEGVTPVVLIGALGFVALLILLVALLRL